MDDLSMVMVYPTEPTSRRRQGVRLACSCGKWSVLAVRQAQALPLSDVINRAMAHVHAAHPRPPAELDPCGGQCSHPAMHAEGGHDV
jgi:hypothetical protein